MNITPILIESIGLQTGFINDDDRFSDSCAYEFPVKTMAEKHIAVNKRIKNDLLECDNVK
jgi:hypothetical protein